MFSGAASAIKNRLRFNHGASETTNQLTSSKSTPDLSLKSAFKDTVSSSLQIRKIADGFDDEDDNLGPNPLTRSFEFREDPSFWEDHNVQVIIRIRPLNSSELSVQGQSRCVRQDCSQSITWTGNPESRFTFDHVADEHVSQEMLFKVAGVPMVENTVGGYNSCMFAYGQTGSGKTHTMLGDIEEGTRRHSVNCGMTPRVFEYLFSRIQKEKEVRREEKIKFTSRCSFLEIYNEHILDLLDPSSTNLQIREDTKKGVYVENLTEVEVSSARDVIQQLVQGAANRKVASTNMNRASSRSHSVFTCVVESKWESQGVTHHRFSRLNLVDLAGSERQKSSGAEGERLKEATNINKSLSTLGLVIMNLVNMSNGKSLHVPYRDSKLTFLLQDSLGGNAKTIIIANISPSSCSSLETLSTLKFAQRAKFIKNNAIVNEDASGDVLAMRTQIQSLKKEVAYLRNLANGGADDHEYDSCLASIPGTPGPFKWDGLNELSTPLNKPHKKTSKNEYEMALVGAFRREKDKDITIQSLTAENQAALQLTKQREDEIQGLKMRLRFREAAIKRLEAVASGKISAETHLLKEKDEQLKEIEVLRTEVACNPEVTRFAMENLRVKEEIRRLKSFYEEGERERMMEQITMLQNKLLEALDWKLMNESNISTVQKERLKSGMDIQDDGFLMSSGQESASPWRTAVNEENEFLRMQAIHNQSELDALHKRFDFCVHEKEKLESYVKDLKKELDTERASKSMTLQESQKEQLGVTHNLMPCSDQVELKTLVDAIATASEREAEAHELAITLSKENDQLKMKLKVLLDDNNKLIELYESTVAENQAGNGSRTEPDVTAEVSNLKQQLMELHEENDKLLGLYEKAMQERVGSQIEPDATAEACILKQQLAELHKENDKLMGLYEKAMQERDGSPQQEPDTTAEVSNLKQQLMELHEENDKLMGLYETAMQERDESQKEPDAIAEASNLKQQLMELHEENDKLMGLYEKAMQEKDGSQEEPDATAEASNLKQQLVELQEEHDKLLGLYEKAMQERDGSQNEPDARAETSNLKQQLTELHEEHDKLLGLYEKAMQERDGSKKEPDVTAEASNLKQQLMDLHEENDKLMGQYEKAMQERDEFKCMLVSSEAKSMDVDMLSENEAKSKNLVEVAVFEDVNSIRRKLVKAQEKLSKSAIRLNVFNSLEKTIQEIDELSQEIERLNNRIQVKQESFESSKHLSLALQEKRTVPDKKFIALKYTITKSVSSVGYFGHREAQARARYSSALASINKKKEELARLEICKDEIMDAQSKIKQSEGEIKQNLAALKVKLEEENRRLEKDRVLVAIDNVEKTDVQVLQTNWQLTGKATDLLKSEEEIPKLQSQIRKTEEKHAMIKKDAKELDRRATKVEIDIKTVQEGLQDILLSVEELSRKVESITREKEMVLGMQEEGRKELENVIREFYDCVFEAEMREEETKILDEDVQAELSKLRSLQSSMVEAVGRKAGLLEEITCQSGFVSDKIEEDLFCVNRSIMEVNSMLGESDSNVSEILC